MSEELSITLVNFKERTLIFHDIPGSYVDDLWLLVKVVRLGKVKEKMTGPAVPLTNKSSVVRRPFAAGCLNITPVVESTTSRRKELYMQLYSPVSTETFPVIQEFIINDSTDSITPLDGKILFNFKSYQGTWGSVGQLSHIRKLPLNHMGRMAIPDALVEGDLRNDFYIVLEEGLFQEAKNVEITIEGRHKDKLANQSSMISFRSMVYLKQSQPKWNEVFKVDLDKYRDIDHIYFHARNCLDNGKFTDLCFAYLMLENPVDGSFVPNGPKRLNCYKHTKNADETYYLKDTLKPLKNELKVSTMLISTKISENSKSPLLNMRNSSPTHVPYQVEVTSTKH